MSNKTTLLMTPTARMGRLIAEGLSKLEEGGLLLAPRDPDIRAQLPEGWAHLQGDSFDPETLLTNVRTADHVVLLLKGGEGGDPAEMSLLSNIADTLEKTQGTLVIGREMPMKVPLPDQIGNQRQGALIRKAEDMLLDRSLTGGFQLALVAIPHIYGPGTPPEGLQERLSAAASGSPYTWPGKPDQEPQLIHIEDAAKDLVAAFKQAVRGGERLWVSGAPEVTMSSLAQLVSEITGGRSRVSWPDVTFLESLRGKYNHSTGRARPFARIPPGRELTPQSGQRKPLGEGLRETLLSLSKTMT